MPVYTVRWSSQISRSNNRLGPPTPAPNAVSGASSLTLPHFLHNLFQIRINNNRRISTNHNINYNNNKNNTINIDKSQLIYSITTNKRNIFLILLWIYKLTVIEIL